MFKTASSRSTAEGDQPLQTSDTHRRTERGGADRRRLADRRRSGARHHRRSTRRVHRRGQLGGHRESARRRRGHAADRPARRPAQQEARAADRARRRAGGLGAGRNHIVPGAAHRGAGTAGRLVRALPHRHLDPARGAVRRPHGFGDVGALRNVGLRRRDRTGRRRPADEPRRRLSPRLLADHRLHRPRHRHRGVHRAGTTPQHERDHRLAGRRGPRDRAVGNPAGDHAGQLLGLDLTMDPGLRGMRRRSSWSAGGSGSAGPSSRWCRPGC